MRPPRPQYSKAGQNFFNITFNLDVSTVTGTPTLDLSGNSPTGEIKGQAGNEVNGGQFGWGVWTPSLEGTFVFNALITATVNGETKTYKADPEMVVSSDGSGNVLPIG